MKFYIYSIYIVRDYGHIGNPTFDETWTRMAVTNELEEARTKALELAQKDQASFGEVVVWEDEVLPAWFTSTGKIASKGRVLCESRPLPHYSLEYVILTEDAGESQRRYG